MPEQGTLRISTRVAPDGSRAELPTEDEKGPSAQRSSIGKPSRYIEIEIADTGVGMSQEFIKDRLFRPFQTTKKKGLGIGLYQCWEAIEAHGGRIEVRSVEGQGTVFNIKLPVVQSDSMKSIEAKPLSAKS
jgi:signal transduction histidine kinase